MNELTKDDKSISINAEKIFNYFDEISFDG